MPPANVRLFLALWPDDAARAGLAAHRDRWRWPAAARPVPDPKLHATLHFIGPFAADRVGALGAALASVRSPALRLHAAGDEVWKGGIAVLTLRREPALERLHAALGDVLTGLGVALDDRPFAPHVTLARQAAGATRPAEPPSLDWRCDGFALVLSRGGAYEVLGLWPASGPAA